MAIILPYQNLKNDGMAESIVTNFSTIFLSSKLECKLDLELSSCAILSVLHAICSLKLISYVRASGVPRRRSNHPQPPPSSPSTACGWTDTPGTILFQQDIPHKSRLPSAPLQRQWVEMSSDTLQVPMKKHSTTQTVQAKKIRTVLDV